MDEARPGLFRACADADMPFDFPSSKGCLGFLQSFSRHAPEMDTREVEETVSFVRSCQDAGTGLFVDPHLDARFAHPDDERAYRDFRLAVTKYAVALLRRLGADPLHEYRYNVGKPGAPDGDAYLEYVKSGDWDAPWAIGSTAASRTVELFRHVNEGHEEYIPHLRAGIEFILSKQNPDTGMWGAGSIPLHEQISGTLKVVGRFHSGMGMPVPHMDRLADSCIQHHADGGFYRSFDDMCIPLNTAYMSLTCMQESDYRRNDLIATAEGVADYLREFRTPDGAFASSTKGTNAIGWCGASVTDVSATPRSNVNGTQGAVGCLGLVGAHLGWDEVYWGGRLPHWRDRSDGLAYRIDVASDGSVRIARK